MGKEYYKKIKEIKKKT